MENLGEIYNGLEEDEIMNVFGYSDPKGKVVVIKVDDLKKIEYEIEGRIMYRVPNYRIITSRRNDAEYVLRDLTRQNAIEISTHKIKELMDEWTSLKRRAIQASKSNTKPKTNAKKVKKVVEVIEGSESE